MDLSYQKVKAGEVMTTRKTSIYTVFGKIVDFVGFNGRSFYALSSKSSRRSINSVSYNLRRTSSTLATIRKTPESTLTITLAVTTVSLCGILFYVFLVLRTHCFRFTNASIDPTRRRQHSISGYKFCEVNNTSLPSGTLRCSIEIHHPLQPMEQAQVPIEPFS